MSGSSRAKAHSPWIPQRSPPCPRNRTRSRDRENLSHCKLEIPVSSLSPFTRTQPETHRTRLACSSSHGGPDRSHHCCADKRPGSPLRQTWGNWKYLVLSLHMPTWALTASEANPQRPAVTSGGKLCPLIRFQGNREEREAKQVAKRKNYKRLLLLGVLSHHSHTNSDNHCLVPLWKWGLPI